jgi:phage shock protein C
MDVENRAGEWSHATQETEQSAHEMPHSASQTGAQGTSTQGTSTQGTATGAGNATPPGEPGGEGRRMLYRHPTDTVLGGVCGGLADYFGWDAALIRILWVVLSLATSGGGLLAYLALWILLPVGTTVEGQQRPATLALNERNLARTAWILIGLGVIWLLGNIGVLPWLWGGFWRVVSIVFWPLLLIGVGYVLLRYIGKTNGWRFGLDSAAGQMRSSLGERMPTSDKVKGSMKSSFTRLRHGFPLKRSSNDRVWMGVCGGIGQRLGIDSNLVRLIWAAFSVGSIGMGVLIYILAGLFLVDEESANRLPYANDASDEAKGADNYRDEDAHDVQIVDATQSR